MNQLRRKVILIPMRLSKVKTVVLGSLAALLVTSCSADEIPGLGFEKGITSVNDQSLSLWQGAWIAAAVVGLITLALIMKTL